MDNTFFAQKHFELTRLGRQLEANQDLPSLLQSSVELACDLAEVKACYIWSVNAAAPLLRAWHPHQRKGTISCLANKSRLARFLDSAQPLFQSDLQASRSPLLEGLGRSRLALFPLVVDRKPWGILAFAGGQSADFTATERIILQQITERIETALRLNLLSDRQLRLQEQISEVWSAFAASPSLVKDPESFLRLICDIFLQLSQADLCLVWKIVDGKPLRLASCARSRRPIKVNELSARALAKKTLRDKGPAGWQATESQTAGSALAIPLKGQKDFVGVITLFWETFDAYNDASKNLLLSFAHYLELSLEHLLLQQADSRTKAQLVELADTGRQIGALPDNSTIIKTTLRTISRTLHCPLVGIALISPDGTLRISKDHIVGTRAIAVREAALCPIPNSLIGQTLKRHSPLALADASSDPLALLLRAKSLGCVPLQGSEGALGLLFVAHRKFHDFADAELALLAAHANQVALALRNTDLAASQMRNMDQLATISEITHGFFLSPEIQPMLQTVLSSACRLVAMKGGLILTEKNAGDGLKITAAQGLDQPPNLKPLSQLEEQGNLAALAFKQHKVIVSSDLSRDGRFNYRALARNGGPLSAIAAPLGSGGRIFGALCAYAWEPRVLSESDKRIFSIMADSLGVAIDNSRRQEEEQHHAAAYSELFREVNRQVRNSLQTIVALLEMTSAESELSSGDALRRSLQRIQCIHLIHSLLSVKSPHQMEIRESARQIAEMAQAACGRSPEEVSISVSGTRVFLSPQKATAFSLAINELINNALNHGLKECSRGKIHINFSQSGSDLLIELSDNGCGLPESFDLEKDARIGLKIASAFVQQKLGGSFHLFRRASGTIAQMRFPC